MDLPELMHEIRKLCPHASHNTDNNGQVIIYTDMMIATPDDNPSIPGGEHLLVPFVEPLEYDVLFGDLRICGCGHHYYRHFDSYERMAPVGCKYCDCHAFWEPLDTEDKTI